LRYRGAIGQWSWVLHRVTGLGVLFFLALHVIDTSWAVFYPDLYVHAIATYQSPLFTIGEFALVAAVVYHALNGIRISLFDFRPKWWKYQQRAAVIVFGLSVLILIPTFILMLGHVLNFYRDNPQTLGLIDVIVAQAPFAGGFAIAIIAAILFSAVFGAIAGGEKDKPVGKGRGSRIERFWWSFMRMSGLIIVPLVFGHLGMMHVIQGVFDITAAGHTVVGTSVVNETGTSVEFVASRWNMLFAGVAIWRLYDFALLALVVVHGFNGLRYVLTDYTMSRPLLRRASVYVCLIGAVILLVLGAGALMNTIDSSAIEIARQAAENLHP
jgi:succinate dehydrogenase / fumarate reductase cytochrome b subunit